MKALIIILFFLMSACSPFRSNTTSLESLTFPPGDPNAPATPLVPSCPAKARVKAIYGEDNRSDWYEVDGVAKDYWAAATVALMSSDALVQRGNYFQVRGAAYGVAMNLCPGTRFYEQPQAAFCSGFLVDQDLLVTAGHCITDQSDCERTRFVFNFAKRSVEQTQYNIAREDVYRCGRLLARSMSGTDFAVIQLDRPVVGRMPLNVRRSGKADLGEELVLIGHPSGIPSKIAAEGIVFGNSDDIIAGVDAFAGNSGSVVVNASSGLVEGILVAGEPDFESRGSCQVEYRCNSANCSGEIITPIGDLLEHIPEKTFESPAVACP